MVLVRKPTVAGNAAKKVLGPSQRRKRTEYFCREWSTSFHTGRPAPLGHVGRSWRRLPLSMLTGGAPCGLPWLSWYRHVCSAHGGCFFRRGHGSAYLCSRTKLRLRHREVHHQSKVDLFRQKRFRGMVSVSHGGPSGCSGHFRRTVLPGDSTASYSSGHGRHHKDERVNQVPSESQFVSHRA